MKPRLLLHIIAALMIWAPSAWAHEARPAFLEIKETEPDRYNLLWRTPLLAGIRLPVVLQLPDGARDTSEPVIQWLTDSVVERRMIEAGRGGLAGKRIEFAGLQATITDVLVHVRMLDGHDATTLVRP
ncbi:MAG: HupE/UreJ family protein, partial [Deltaproteobacteria bacterium]|nr:HupE/UreJ family protein [Deltaproteobacteria bacterium]